MKNLFIKHSEKTGIILMLVLCFACAKKEPSLKDTFKDHFLIGAAINSDQILGTDSLAHEILIKHFNALTGENAMKWERIHPLPGSYYFTLSDSLVSFARKNNMFVTGHTLLWHHQTPEWVFEDSTGKPLTRDSLLAVLKDHIFTVVGRYKGQVQSWDVVNEALEENGSLRKSKWLEIIGEDYIEKAFEFAKEADPDAELYYNDYNIETAPKRDSAVKLISTLKAKGIKIDGVGIQGHYHLDFPQLADIDSAIRLFGNLGVKVMFTELDINILPKPENFTGANITDNYELRAEMNPYVNGLPDSASKQLADRYADMFKIFLKYPGIVSRVTFWGIYDGQSWLNDWPINGRTNYPLLFDRNYKPKQAFYSVIKTVKN